MPGKVALERSFQLAEEPRTERHASQQEERAADWTGQQDPADPATTRRTPTSVGSVPINSGSSAWLFFELGLSLRTAIVNSPLWDLIVVLPEYASNENLGNPLCHHLPLLRIHESLPHDDRAEQL